MNKTGLVLKVEKNSATLITSAGQFVKVTTSTKPPKVGETYTGILRKENSYIKGLAAIVALFIIFVTGGGGAYAYYTPVATVQVSINPSIELKINRFDRIIKSSPINKDGTVLLKNLQLKNKNLDEALILVVDKAKKDNFINNNYVAQGKAISVKISAKDTSKVVKLDKFEKYISHNKINTNIDNNGKKNSNTENVNSDKIKPIESNLKKENNINNNKKKDVKSDKTKPVENKHKSFDKSKKSKGN